MKKTKLSLKYQKTKDFYYLEAYKLLSLGKLTFLFSFLFFFLALLTLKDYGINWDTINHLPRGQAYLNYFLYGYKNYSNLPVFFHEWQKKGQWYLQNPNSLFINTDIPRDKLPARSLYQVEELDFNYFMEKDGNGHPPLSDILSSVFNILLFQKLGLINDIDSYRVYGVLLAALLIGLVFYWSSTLYGKWVGLISVFSLSTYPLFWSEAHFNNEKDIPETVFFSFMLFSFWKGITTKNWVWIIVSGFFFGLALGTKLNVLFSVFIILPWLSLLLFNNIKHKQNSYYLLKKNLKIILAIIAAPLLGVLIVFVTWPYLWVDTINRALTVFKFYKEIGLSSSIDSRFVTYLGINTYPIKWILYTTPIVTLLLFFIGFIVAIFQLKKEKNKETVLFAGWLLIPVLRVILPGTAIYGGVRQLMEFIPAMSIFAGLGGIFLIKKVFNHFVKSNVIRIFNYQILLLAIIIIFFLPITIKLIKIHPNENVYFNPLIGGLSGARQKNIPFWGNSYGSVYRQGAIWLNENAPYGASIAYARELIPNLPRIWLRQDLNLHNNNRSGSLRGGEYIIGLTYEGVEKTSYFDRYLDRFLEPVYSVNVDGVPILKIWKNDLDHTKLDFKAEVGVDKFNLSRQNSKILIDLGKSVSLSKLYADFTISETCSKLDFAYIMISTDGKNWNRLPGLMPGEDWGVPQFGNQPKYNKVFIPFAGDKAKFIEIVYSPFESCFASLDNVKIFVFPNF